MNSVFQLLVLHHRRANTLHLKWRKTAKGPTLCHLQIFQESNLPVVVILLLLSKYRQPEIPGTGIDVVIYVGSNKYNGKDKVSKWYNTQISFRTFLKSNVMVTK